MASLNPFEAKRSFSLHREIGLVCNWIVAVVGDDTSNLEAVKAARVSGKAKEQFAPLYAELEALKSAKISPCVAYESWPVRTMNGPALVEDAV